MPKVSIIIPIIEEDNVDTTIKSVLNQSLSDIEILIVCNETVTRVVDSVNKIIESDSRIKLFIKSAIHCGELCNYGLSIAKGKYVGFIEAGDQYHTHMIDSLYEECDTYSLDYAKLDYEYSFNYKGSEIYLRDNAIFLAGENANDRFLYGRTLRPSDFPQFVYTDVNVGNGLYNKEFIYKNCIRMNSNRDHIYYDFDFYIQSIMCAEKAKFLYELGYIKKIDINMTRAYAKELSVSLNEMERSHLFFKDNLNCEIGCAVLKRLLRFYMESYKRAVLSGVEAEECRDYAEQLRQLLNDWMKELNGYYYESVMNDFSVQIYSLRRDVKSFYLLENEFARMEDEKIQNFLKTVTKHRKCVIFGSGRRGRICYAFLIKKGCEKVECFCDNDSTKDGTQVMGLEVILPEEANMIYENALFIIAIKGFAYYAIYKQLLGLGIKDENICKAEVPNGRFAFETTLI